MTFHRAIDITALDNGPDWVRITPDDMEDAAYGFSATTYFDAPIHILLGRSPDEVDWGKVEGYMAGDRLTPKQTRHILESNWESVQFLAREADIARNWGTA